MRAPLVCLVASLALSLALTLAACSGDREPPAVVVARVNDYVLTREEFERRLVEETRYRGDQPPDQAFLASFLDQTVRKELLIQEAIRLRLDREEQFLRAIERHWENTLIRDVLERQGKRIAETTVVTEEAVRALYRERQAEDPALPPYETLASSLRDELRDQAMTKALDAWIDSLRGQAHVELHLDRLGVQPGQANQSRENAP